MSSPRSRSKKEMRGRGLKADFRATGQTGTFIAGDGVSIDAVVSDFVSGAVEWHCPAGEPHHWDLIEGQGSLFQAPYAGVTLALIHGAQPDALVMCHEPTRRHMRGLPHTSLPDLELCIERNVEAAQLTNPAVRCVGVSVNSAALDAAAAKDYLRRTEDRLFGLPTIDPRCVPASRRSSIAWHRLIFRMAPHPQRLSVTRRIWPLARSFAISRGSKTTTEVVIAEIFDGEFRGRGECVPYPRYGESVDECRAGARSHARESLFRPRPGRKLQRAMLSWRVAQCAGRCVLGPRRQARRPPRRRHCRARSAEAGGHGLYARPRHARADGRGRGSAARPAIAEAQADRRRRYRAGAGGAPRGAGGAPHCRCSTRAGRGLSAIWSK